MSRVPRVRQKAIEEVVRSVDVPELSDIDLVARILDLRSEKARIADAHKKAQQSLIDRLVDRGVTEAYIGEHVVSVTDTTLLKIKKPSKKGRMF